MDRARADADQCVGAAERVRRRDRADAAPCSRRSRVAPTATRRGATRRRRGCCPTAGSRSCTPAGAWRSTVTGQGHPRPLAVGPNPLAPAPDAATEAAIARGDQLAIDAGMKWMIDFDEAESVGMALRIPIPAATLTAGLDSLVVFGVVRSLSVAETADQLADLLRRPPLHRRPRVRPSRHADQQHRRSPRRLQLRRSRATSAAFDLEVAGTPGARRQQRAAHRHRAGPAVRSHPADVRPRRARARARRPPHAQHEHRAVAGRLGLLPQQHDRHRSRADAARPRVGAPALPRPRAQLRTVAGAPLRRAAVRPPAGDVARSLAAGRQARQRAGRLAQGHADRAARQPLAPGARRPSRESAIGRIQPIPMPISPT